MARAHYTKRSRVNPARIYRGTSDKVAASSSPAVSIAVPEDDPDAVQCEACGAYVKKLVRGQPMAHAPGGVRTNTRLGRYRCEGSGTLA